jgi:hypothetical protein
MDASNTSTVLFIVLFGIGIGFFLLMEWLNERHQAAINDNDRRRGFEVSPPKGPLRAKPVMGK